MNIGVIFAGGTGSRMHSKDKPKQFLEVFNIPIIIYTLRHFEESENVDAVVISCIEDWIPHLIQLIDKFHIKKVEKIVPGGDTGQMSIYNGLCAAKDIAGTENTIVLIHDGVRPLINAELLTRNIECVQAYGSAITAGIVKETIVEIDEDGNVLHVPSRSNSRVAKAPQSFWLKDILAVHEQAQREGERSIVDSCTLMQQYGFKLHMIDGPNENIKITTPDDFFAMRAILEARENAQLYGFE